ncbi:MSP7-like protein, putative [Plasmodium ovale]|uniref:Merozoite surface protein 7 (MSP7) n=2 Tax=Plasmodium ovale TaxID=36330 RepID=A0A1A8WER7_PLAOA|nr:merozoite surface protein 7 (MSP7) [Plasmodium ovale curtisi]SBT02498.1 merozoite surface protein 7 (MSP7) [Plasmodium ovale curtisi]SCP05416.1 MSP7-like protein, putative [Plasmodium ovale]
MVKQFPIFSAFCFLLLPHLAPSKCKSTNTGKKGNYNEDVVNILKKKLGNVYNAGPNNANEAIHKKYEQLEKELQEMQSYQKGDTAEDFGQTFMNETDETSGKKKTIFGVDEDDLDNYDEEFFGQSKTTIKGEAVSANSPVEPSQGKAQSGESLQGKATPVLAATPGKAAVSPDSDGTEQKISPIETPTPDGATISPPGNANSLGEVKETEPQSPPDSEQPQKPVGENALHAGQAGKNPTGSRTNTNVPKVQYLDDLYDDVINETNTNSQANIPKYVSNYDSIEKKYEFPMTSKEYNMVKMLFGDCFKKGNDVNSNTACLVDLFKKVLEDKEFQKEFVNFMHGIYSFAKRHNYLSDARMKDENLYNDLFKNSLNLLDTF